MKKNKTEIKIYAEIELIRSLRDLAKKQGKSVSQIGRVLLEAALEDLDESMRSVKQQIFEHIGSVEQRMARTLVSQGERIEELTVRMAVLHRMIDCFVLSYFQHTREVPSAEHGAKRRHDLWKAAVTRPEGSDG